ncbi:hypothetical protein, partial [Methylicorpusculum sp.]|uniref:hypothetical protein n=1 Tax=Methylicorpusculum sp. TaxID=2713644 RepID=UPI002AB97563
WVKTGGIKRINYSYCTSTVAFLLQDIPFALQISAAPKEATGVFGKGFASMDAGIEPTWMYLRRPLTGTPMPNFDLR